MNTDAIRPTARPEKGATIHLLLTCLCDAFYPDAGIAAVACLEAAGYSVAFDDRQTCCGQPAFNTGDRSAARQVARHTLDVFKRAEAVVVPSGSCTAMIRWGYPQLFRNEPDFEAAINLARRTYEFHEFLIDVADMIPWPGSYDRKTALHRSCHMRELAIDDGVERLLGSIRGLELVAVDTPEQCCGFGGTFAVTFPWTSREIGMAKLDALRRTGAREFVSTDMGCAMHLQGLHAKSGKSRTFRLRHTAELLRDSLNRRAG